MERHLTCESCDTASEDVVTTLDPFAYEIYDEEIYMNLCEDCLQRKRDDI